MVVSSLDWNLVQTRAENERQDRSIEQERKHMKISISYSSVKSLEECFKECFPSRLADHVDKQYRAVLICIISSRGQHKQCVHTTDVSKHCMIVVLGTERSSLSSVLYWLMLCTINTFQPACREPRCGMSSRIVWTHNPLPLPYAALLLIGAMQMMDFHHYRIGTQPDNPMQTTIPTANDQMGSLSSSHVLLGVRGSCYPAPWFVSPDQVSMHELHP